MPVIILHGVFHWYPSSRGGCVSANDSDDGAVSKRPRLSASTITPIDSIDPDRRADVEGAISQLFDIDTPRDLQMEVIHHCAYNDNAVVYVNAKTAELLIKHVKRVQSKSGSTDFLIAGVEFGIRREENLYHQILQREQMHCMNIKMADGY